MKQNAMRKNLRQSILKSMGRYIAIAAIIALGAGLFLGLLMTKSDMVATGQVFMDEQNMFDLRLMNSYGWTDAYLAQVAALEGVEDVEGVRYIDLIARFEGAQEDAVYRFLELPERVNKVALRSGRMPEKPNECLADGFHADDSILGKTVTIAASNEEDALDMVKEQTFTVVGYVATPLYIDMNRGTTTVGSGSLSSYFYVLPQALNMDYYAEINVTIPGDYAIYSERYEQALDAAADALEADMQVLADQRLEQVKEEALEALQEGLEAYTDGLMEYAQGKADADKQLNDAYQELLDGEQQLKDSEKMLQDGETQLDDARLMMIQGEKTLQESKRTLAKAKADAYKHVSESTTRMLSQLQGLRDGLQGIQNELNTMANSIVEMTTQILPVESKIAAAQAGIAQTKTMLGILDLSIGASKQALDMAKEQGLLEPEAIARMEGEYQDLLKTREGYNLMLINQETEKAEFENQRSALLGKRQELENAKAALEANANQMKDSIAAMTQGLVELAATQALMDNEFAAADAQVEAGEAQLKAGQLEIELQQATIEQGWEALEEGRQDLKEGWKEYEKGKAEAQQELADALAEIQDAGQELKDARQTIDAMVENEIIILDRSSNVGYNNLESSSDIVAGVSRIMPVFFLLVASLVCITTMTRMIEEERTQIGTLKALGYSNAAIISKYLFYSGSGAVLGCALGIWAGCTIFPQIIWQAYCIMLYIQPDVVLTVNWTLALAVAVVYTAVIMFVTWYSCHKTLEEVPAELIRPKSPDAGKKILMEYLPFWSRISFLNKVTIRNIFRYRQRLAMMMVGIGGCTALLLTGFGLRDSITNVVDYQFENVTLYDISVYFREEPTQEDREDFGETVSGQAQSYMFYHQSSMELEFDGRVKEIYMISGSDQLSQFISLHEGSREVTLPRENEVVLSVGVAENMGIHVGDTVTMRSSDMQSLDLTVSGIYDNHVYNYSIIDPETMETQWGHTPELQMAFLRCAPEADVHMLSADISELKNVMNVSISADMADMVGSMMEALDLVVWVIVFCAGLLAVIVLYNLTNININERIREIATIKVLGFNAGETASYVFKENMTLTVAGSLFGLGLGWLLLIFVMSQIKIDMVWFKCLIEPVSYLWSVALTLLSAIAVDFIFYFKLEKINMAEALKSVE